MVKQWGQPPTHKNRMVPGGVLVGSHLTIFILYFFIKTRMFIGILGAP